MSMLDFFEQLFVRGANGLLRAREPRPVQKPGVTLGEALGDASARMPVVLTDSARPEHIAILGKTGTGKSSLMRLLASDDIERNRGAVHIDLHGDTTPFLLKVLAARERTRHEDLSDRIVLIDPSDPDWAVGLNVLQAISDAQRFVQLTEVAQLLKQRWDLTSFGPRTEELLRNALFALSAADLTLVELAPLLTNATFRRRCLRHVANADIRAYFETRYDQASDAMQAVMRDAVLNKISTFTADPHFRHILGQRHATLSLTQALDRGCWILLHLPKGRLGEQAATLGSLFLTHLKRALFARTRRTLVTVYADELQNLVDYTTGIDTLLAEARKFGVGFVTANQFLDQYPAAMRAAVLSVGTHIFFQLSAQDAERATTLIGNGKSTAHLLRELPHRHAVMRRGGEGWQHFKVRPVTTPDVDVADLTARVQARWAQRRDAVDRDIAARVQPEGAHETPEGDLDDWA